MPEPIIPRPIVSSLKEVMLHAQIFPYDPLWKLLTHQHHPGGLPCAPSPSRKGLTGRDMKTRKELQSSSHHRGCFPEEKN